MSDTEVAFIRRALQAFEEAAEMEEAARQKWLAVQRLSDPALATEVERLFLADAHALHAMPTGGVFATPPPPPPRIGQYRVVERIGGGGMGEVFVGARADGMFDHHVAIKRMNPSLLPETSRALFDKERRALAQLSHRNIAQLFDGGIDETGAPYLIMELVRGAPVAEHLARLEASVRDVAWHVSTICSGVQFAHQHLIVHADLKPANILVNEAGDPKIVDFGVARILGEEVEAAAVYPHTPVYASPQRKAGATPSPADDIYSLGVVLKELLTEIPAGAMQDPHATPSEILAVQTPHGRGREWALRRARACAGDLDAIAMRACAKVAEARYPSAAEMAEDLRSWMDHRPLKARRGDRLYVAKKFVRRRRLRVIAGTLAAAGLLASLAIVSFLYAEAEQARRQAEQRFAEVRNLAKYLVHDAYDRLEQAPLTLALRHDLTEVAKGYLEQLAQTPSAPIDVKRDVVVSFVRLAELQAGRRSSNLGKPGEARETLDRAEALLAEIARQERLTPTDIEQQISIDLLRALLAANADQNLDEAAARQVSAQQRIEHLPEGPEKQRLRVWASVEASDLANWRGEYPTGAADAKTAINLISQLGAADRATPLIRETELRVRTLLGDAYYYLGKPREAAKEYAELIELADAWFKEDPASMRARRQAILARWNLGTTLLGEGEAREALDHLEEAADLLGPLVAFEPADANTIRTESIVQLAYAQGLVATGQLERGLAAARAQAETRRKRHVENPDAAEHARSYAIMLSALGDLLAENGRKDEACPVYVQARAEFEDLRRRGRLTEFDLSGGSWTLLEASLERYCSGR